MSTEALHDRFQDQLVVPRELRGRESDSEEAKEEHKALILKRRSKQTTVVGEFKPEMFLNHRSPEGIWLKGGPSDGVETTVPRGSESHTRPAASSEPGNAFIPAEYRRTKERNKDGLTIFRFVEATA